MLGRLGWGPDALDHVTLRELSWAFTGRQRAEWDQTAALAAMIHNCAPGCRIKVDPDRLNPYARRSVSGGMRGLQSFVRAETRNGTRRHGRV